MIVFSIINSLKAELALSISNPVFSINQPAPAIIWIVSLILKIVIVGQRVGPICDFFYMVLNSHDVKMP